MTDLYSPHPVIVEGHSIGIKSGNLSYYMTSVAGPAMEDQRANARRFADCWNACLGISNEHLSQGLIPLHRFSGVVDERDQLAAKVRYYEQALCRSDAPFLAASGGSVHMVAVRAPSIELVADVLRQRDDLLAMLEEIIAADAAAADELERIGIADEIDRSLTDRARALAALVRGAK